MSSAPEAGSRSPLLSDRRAWLIVGGLTLLALALRLITFRDSLNGDELFMYSIVHDHSLGQALHIVRETEKTPPLVFVLDWATSHLGDNTLWIRLPSLICGVSLVPLAYALGRRCVSQSAGLVAAALVTFSGFAIFYGVEDRAYAAVACSAAIATLCLLKAVDSDRRRWWGAYVLAVLATVYTHYIGFFVIGAQIVWTVWVCRRRIGTLAVVYGLIALAYLPWIPSYVIQQRHSAEEAHRIAVLAPPSVSRFGLINGQDLFGQPFTPLHEIPGNVPLALAVGAVLVAGLVGAAGAWRARGGWSTPGWWRWRAEHVLLALVAVAAPVGAVVLSLRPGMSFMLPRNLSSSYVPAMVAIAALLVSPRRALAVPATVIVLAVLILGGIRTLQPSHRRIAYRDAAHFVEARSTPSSPVIQQFFLSGDNGALRHPVDINFRHPRFVATSAAMQPQAWARGRKGVPVFVVVDLPDVFKSVGGKALPPRYGPGKAYVRTAERVYSGFSDLVVAEYRYAPG